MSTNSPYVASWGIIGTGWIATKFVEDLSISCESLTDILHSVVAVGSNDRARAAEFIERVCPKRAVAQQRGLGQVAVPEPYGSYAEVLNHKDVDIIYIGTLHPSHYIFTRAALEAGKHCLVEKPASLNAAEWFSLSALAKERKLFLMEAVWTRFLPIIPKLQKALFEEKLIGDVRAVQATFGMCHDSTPLTHRLLSPAAAGGAMLDLGVYTIVPSLIALYHNPANHKSPPEKVHGTMILGPSGCDITTSISMVFPNINALGVGTATFAMNSPKDQRCFISGTTGEITFRDHINRPTSFTIRRIVSPQLDPEWEEDVVVEADVVGFGLIYEANEVARCVRDGQIESAIMSHDETAMVMRIFDLVREQNGHRFEEGLEQVR